MGELTMNQMKWMFNSEREAVEAWAVRTWNEEFVGEILEIHRAVRGEVEAD